MFFLNSDHLYYYRFEYYYLEATKKKLAGLHDEAFALYRHCLELNPEAGEVMYELGLYYMGLRNEEEGERYLKHAVAVEPDNIYYKEALASYYLRKRDTKHAVTVLEDMVRCNPPYAYRCVGTAGVFVYGRW